MYLLYRLRVELLKGWDNIAAGANRVKTPITRTSDRCFLRCSHSVGHVKVPAAGLTIYKQHIFSVVGAQVIAGLAAVGAIVCLV